MLLRNTLFIVLFITASSAQQTFLAVHDFEGKSVSEVEASALTDRLRTEIINMGQVSVVERAEMDEVLREQGYQQTGCFTSECMVEVGKMIGAEKIVSGSISKVGSTFSINARIINVETGEIENSITYDLSGVIDELLISGMRNVSQLLFTANKEDYIELNTTYEYYNNGQVKSEGQLIGDIKVGRWIYYHDNGRIQKIGAYRNNKEIGQWTYFYPDGKKKMESTHKDGELDGQLSYYSADGKLLYEIPIVNIENSDIVLCGPSDETLTQIKHRKSFLSNLFKEIAFFRTGEIIEFYPNGKILSTVQILNKMADGNRILFSEQGDTMNIYPFIRGKGNYTSYTSQGEYITGYCKDYTGFSMTKIGKWGLLRKDESIEVTNYDDDGNVIEDKP